MFFNSKEEEAQRKAWLNSLKPGDKVVVDAARYGMNDSHYYIDTIAHITPKRTRFDLKDYGGMGFNAEGEHRVAKSYAPPTHIIPLTPEIKATMAYQRALSRVEDVKWKNISRDALMRIAQIVTEDQQAVPKDQS